MNHEIGHRWFFRPLITFLRLIKKDVLLRNNGDISGYPVDMLFVWCYLTINLSLSVLNKHNVIVNDNTDNRQWIRCFKCFNSFHLTCLSKHDGYFFDDHVIFRGSIDEPFLCKNC